VITAAVDPQHHNLLLDSAVVVNVITNTRNQQLQPSTTTITKKIKMEILNLTLSSIIMIALSPRVHVWMGLLNGSIHVNALSTVINYTVNSKRASETISDSEAESLESDCIDLLPLL